MPSPRCISTLLLRLKMDFKEKIAELESELSTTKYNKATQHSVGLLKAKIAKLKREMIVEAKKGGKHTGFSVKKTGDATVTLVGFPSVGKSTLLNSITNAKSEVGAYDFTTIDVIPGTLLYKGAKIQLLDIPGLIVGAAKGFGRGKEVLSVIKASDLIIIVLDERSYPKYAMIMAELYNADIRLNGSPPNVSVERSGFGGIDLGTTVRLTKMEPETVKGIMREVGFTNATIVIRQDVTQDQLIDALEGNRLYIPGIVIVNKSDLMSTALKQKIASAVKPDLFVSAEKRANVEQLKDLIFTGLGLIRIFMKQPGKDADLSEPMIMRRGTTISDVCTKIHKQILKNLRFARVWGSSRFPGQKLGLSYKLKDGDILQLHID